MIIKNKLALAVLFVCPFIGLNSAYSAPAGQHQIQIQTSTPKRTGETAFSIFVSWKKGESRFYKANGLTFIGGSESKKPTSDIEVARKIAHSLDAGVANEAPTSRGVIAKSTKDKAEVLLSNKEGFDLTRLTVRDYSNQQLQFSTPGSSYKSASVRVAIDLVYSAAVEYVDGFSSGIKQEAAGGTITVVIDKNKTIEIKTDGKTTKQLETELAQALGGQAKVSLLPIYPNFVSLKSRNYKAFDGGEIQLEALNAKNISIDINDSGLGVLTKFEFPGAKKQAESGSNLPYIIVALILTVLGYVFYRRKIINDELA